MPITSNAGAFPGHRRAGRRTGPAPQSLVEIQVFPASRRPRLQHQRQRRRCQPTDTEDIDRPADRTFHYRDNGDLEYAIEFTAPERNSGVRFAPDLSIVEFKGGSEGRLQVQAQFLPAGGEGAEWPGRPREGPALGNRSLGVEV